MNDKPKYLDKHPCEKCGTGYGECAQGAAISMKCCVGCKHPTRWLPNPWTPEDIREMEQVSRQRDKERKEEWETSRRSMDL